MNVSTLITNYNYGRYLKAGVESVLRQTHAVHDIVVVDDGSTDDSRSVIAELAALDDRIVPVFQRNAGQAAAINAGFERCTGDVVCMLDADDVWYDHKVSAVSAAFAANPAAVMVMNGYDLIDPDGRVVERGGKRGLSQGDLGPLVVRTGGAWIFSATSGLSLRRTTLEKILPIPDRQWRLCADGAIAYPAAFLGRIVSLKTSFGGYRLHGLNNHYAAGTKAEKVQADLEASNRYLNNFLSDAGHTERVDLLRNLSYRRDRFYRNGGGPREFLAVARLIVSWPLYDGVVERLNFFARFALRACLPRRLDPRAASARH